jgi:sortase A
MKRTLLIVMGASLLALSVVFLGVVGFQTVGTSIASTQAIAAARSEVANLLEGEVAPTEVQSLGPLERLPGGSVTSSSPAAVRAARPEQGETFGLVYVPKLRSKAWAQPLSSGIENEQLNSGIGHFPSSAMPGELGNFAIAGHRATYGEPFAHIDELVAGDSVIIRTAEGWFVYTLTKDQIVKPEAVWVVDPVPGMPGTDPTEALLTIVTCEPRWGSTSRWIWWGELTEVLPVDSPPAEIVQYGA